MSNHNYQSAEQAYAYPLLIKNLLSRARLTASKQEIIYADKKRMTYDDFFRRINQFANVLADLGLEKGDVIAVMDWDTPRYLEAYFAIPMSEYIIQTVNIRLSPEKILYTINHAQPKVLMLNSEFAPMVKDYQFDNSSIEHIIWLDDHGITAESILDTNSKHVVGEYEALLASANDEFEFADFDENTVATTFYTSGTTGNPKGVFFTHRQLVLHSLTLVATFAMMPEGQGVSFNDVYMPATPMFHVHAWGMPYTSTMCGLKQVYPGRYIPELMVNLIKQEGVTFTHGVPTVLQMLLQQAEVSDTHFDGLKMTIGGSKLTEGLAKSAMARGIKCVTGYGMSETAPLLCTTDVIDTSLSEDEQIRQRCKTGKPVLMVDVQLWNDNNEPVPADGESTGELVIRTPWLTQSYFKNEDKGNELWEGGYLHTGDIAKMSADGTVQITDRLKDVIKSGGEWISSLELETILSLHPSVADIAVIGVEDEQWGERPLALVVKKATHADTTAEEIRALAEQAVERGLLPSYGVPKQFKFLDELPKTSVGKHDKKVMRAMFG
ncbi:MAG: fatty acid--CoA ligase [Moraxellaceae bacterium]|nr:fatty acid--CoA ligase [Moraxellaceae bacterium]